MAPLEGSRPLNDTIIRCRRHHIICIGVEGAAKDATFKEKFVSLFFFLGDKRTGNELDGGKEEMQAYGLHSWWSIIGDRVRGCGYRNIRINSSSGPWIAGK